ncbi:nmrA-like family domain-containing protein 1 [Kogia breviceps]|uniref:nmrA-like family domain-containing protein 1 n=1 Tax=Kogia breviceps TaxID=27615 RepID=UPI0034D1F176
MRTRTLAAEILRSTLRREPSQSPPLAPPKSWGGSVARAILESKNYEVRALAMEVTQPNAQVLRALGPEVVKGGLNDKASVEDYLKGAFMVTNFWDHFSKEKEVCRGEPPLSPFFFSSLATLPSLEGTLPMGDVPMDGISVADVGEVICSSFNLPEKFVGKVVGLSEEALTVQQYADVLSKGLGKEVRDAEITLEACEKLEFPVVKEMANMCHFYQMKPDRDIKLTHGLNPKVKSFSQFI